MKWCVLVQVVILSALAGAQNPATQKVKRDVGPPALGIHWAKGVHAAKTGGGPDMTFHGGTVLTTTFAEAIFWGTSWATGAVSMRATSSATFPLPTMIARFADSSNFKSESSGCPL